MEWVAIVAAIMEMVQSCRENRDRDDIEADALNRPLGRWMIRRTLRDKGLRGEGLRNAMQQVRNHEMDDDDVRDFLTDALGD